MKKLSHTNAIYLDQQALKMINYDEDEHTLVATFNNDRTYQYKKVPNLIWLDFLKAMYKGVPGTFINKEIKPFYECVEIS